MRGRPAAGRFAALVLWLAITGIGLANTARAFEWDLPGERKFSIHGFYEMRLLFTGEELPAHDITFSQFRHVLNLEFELSLFPDGFGPFDTMFLYTRVLASYDCIYTRGCGLFHAADSYGDAARSAVRQPASLKTDVQNKSPYFAGLLKQLYVPGTLASPVEILNPSRRYRTCVNDAGVFDNPNPLAAFCNLNARSELSGPLKPGLPAFVGVRSGSYSTLANEQLLAAARTTLGETEFARLHALLVGSETLSITEKSLYSALTAEAAEARAAGHASTAQQLDAQAAAILGVPATDFNANIPTLLGTRPDPNRFAIFAKASTPELLSSKWGSNKIGPTIFPFLATINTPIKPQGYFSNVAALRWFGSYETGLSDDVQVNLTGAPASTDSDGVPIINPAISQLRAQPFFVGADGIRNTPDDLPFVAKNPTAQAAGYSLSAPLTGPDDRFDALQGSGNQLKIPIYSDSAKITLPSAADPNVPRTVELYGVFSEQFRVLQTCALSPAAGGLGGVFNRAAGTCTDKTGHDVTQQALARSCLVIANNQRNNQQNFVGTNGDGDCIDLNFRGTSVPYEVLGLLADPRVRPSGAANAPPDGTDLRLYGNIFGTQLPARPRQASNGLNFYGPGTANFYNTHKAVVSNLDLGFTEDQLQWNHGASQREDEFAEGYVEFETLDSQVFARVGKQIVIWGKTELFRNQDRNNPLDIGNGLFGPIDEQRVAQWAADVTISPEWFMRVGPVEDLRLELLWIFDKFTPTDLGKCGEGGSVDLICLKSFGAMASGLTGLGIAGEQRPNNDYNGLSTWDYGARVEGRWDRFTFAVSDFWGWDDSFYLNPIQHYERTADLTSGAPLSISSRDGGTCTIRRNAKGQAVGPDGIPGNGDDVFPSQGNCLLWTKPVHKDPNDPNSVMIQQLRAPAAVASLQMVNQTLFHSICSFTFSQDLGYCALDQVNNPDIFGPVSQILGGFPTFVGAVLGGVDLIRTAEAPYDTLGQTQGSSLLLHQFMAVNPNTPNPSSQLNQDLGVNLQPEQAALLGCGPAYASPCSIIQAQIWNTDPSIKGSVGSKVIPGAPVFSVGGIDLMNADASVVTQEFVGLKALEPGALVGTHTLPSGQQVYLPGMNYSRNGTFKVVPDPSDATAAPGLIEQGTYLNLTPQQVIDMGRVGRAEFQNDPNNPRQADGWIEPMPWQIDRSALKKWGAIVFQVDPNDPLSLTSPLNHFNLINPKGPIAYGNIDGEYCGRWMNTLADEENGTPFNHGCTALEIASANFERLLISQEIIGFDHVFSPPRSLTELSNWASGAFNKMATGNPISGPDGIFARNSFVFDKQQEDFSVVRGRVQAGPFVVAPGDNTLNGAAVGQKFLNGYDPNSCTAVCYLDVTKMLVDPNLVTSQPAPLVIDMPISYTVSLLGDPNHATTRVNLAALEMNDLKDLRRLFAGQVVTVSGHQVQMTTDQRNTLFGDPTKAGTSPSNSGGSGFTDLNNDLLTDLDQNRDGVWDGQDDFTPGPVTDDNILCGSGMPGDPLQDAAQYEPYRVDQAPGSAQFKARFPNGLPPRSPVFCKSVAGLLGGTTQTLPIRKAGGDGRFGRRDFLWQGGEQVALRYQKKNVFGFGLDFAEDVSKTSWGIEFSWMAHKLFANSTTFSGLSQSDELVLSISVDRPTFFNFLNPNRSFFLNLQMFVRYLPNYVGSRTNKDGMYGAVGGQFSGNVVFTFFTGYFQDRLAPRVSILYAPLESQGAIITGLSYRWNDAFSTTLGYSNFFGHVYTSQGSYFPIAQYSSPELQTGSVFRGVAPVLNRDQAELRFRYTW